MASNLPPGVTEGMIPGNRPEDEEWEEFCEWVLDTLGSADLDVDEARRAVLIGIAAVNAERLLVTARIQASIQDYLRERELEEGP